MGIESPKPDSCHFQGMHLSHRITKFEGDVKGERPPPLHKALKLGNPKYKIDLYLDSSGVADKVTVEFVGPNNACLKLAANTF